MLHLQSAKRFSEYIISFITIMGMSICACKCYTSQASRRLVCSNLHSFPHGNETVEVLVATNNSFHEITSKVFIREHFTSVKAAVLRSSGIVEIKTEAFKGLSELILLDLGDNKLETLSEGTFIGAESLKILILTNNRIRYLEKTTFFRISDLIYLDLSHNNLVKPKNFLNPLPLIKYLDISYNPLAQINYPEILVSNSLKILRLSLARLGELPDDIFANVNNLQVLELSGQSSQVLPLKLLDSLGHLHTFYLGTLRINEEILPTTLEKLVQAEMEVNSTTFVGKILENADNLSATSDDIDFLQYLDDYISENEDNAQHGMFYFKSALLLCLLIYLSILFTVFLSKLVRIFIDNRYQHVETEDYF